MVVAVVAGAELSALELSKVTEKENRSTNKRGTEGGIEGSSEEGEGEREGGRWRGRERKGCYQSSVCIDITQFSSFRHN